VAARPPHRRRHEIAPVEAVAVAVDDGERLVAEDEGGGAVRHDAEQALRDLAVGAAHADLEHAEAHPVVRRLRDVCDARRVRDALVEVGDGSLETLVEIPHAGHMRLNDGACDPAGRFWVGSMALAVTPGVAALYCYADGSLARVVDGVTLSNGLGWSPDASLM